MGPRKLTLNQVKKIKRLLKLGMSQSRILSELKITSVGKGAVHSIHKGSSWSWVEI